MPMDSQAKLRALVVDDSAYNRRTITAMLQAQQGVEVVGRAMNGKEALRMAFDLVPDVITLDLEMPEMDGFSFLRLLMTKRPTPVLVVSSYSQRENVFRALELGALDFIAKPTREVSPDIRNIEHDLLQKVDLVRKLQVVRLRDRARSLARSAKSSMSGAPPPAKVPHGPAASRVVAVAASTGGPPAVQQMLCGLPRDFSAAVIIAQHMPARFTKAFADRLDRLVPLQVIEAVDGHPICEGVVYVAPGSGNVEVARAENGAPMIRVVSPDREARGGPVITPSGDHLFTSLAHHFGPRLCAVVLTGMGSDGRRGCIAARAAGAKIVAEDPDSAVMPGMPYSVIEDGLADHVVGIEDLAPVLVSFCRDV